MASHGGKASAEEVFDSLGDHELAVLHALERVPDLDDAGLASEARLRVSTASEAAHRLHELGLLERSMVDGRERFRLARDEIRLQIEKAADALFSTV